MSGDFHLETDCFTRFSVTRRYKKAAKDNSQPSISMVSHPQIQPTTDGKDLKTKSYVVVDGYYVIRPKMVASVQNMYRLFYLVIIP